MNKDINGDLGNFLEENELLPNFDHQEAISFSPSSSLEITKDSFGTSQDSNNDMSIGDFKINDLWDDLDPRILTRDNDQTKPEFFENICEFVEKGLTEVLFGKPFKDNIGSGEDLKGGVIWFKIGNDRTIFNMPRAKKKIREVDY
ncbi:hypothetical protein Tco_0475144 [Tanacetum coccineum]